MIYILTYVLIYGPPLLVGYLFYRRRKKRLEETRTNSPLQLYFVPFIVFTIASLLWSGLLFGISYFFSQG